MSNKACFEEAFNLLCGEKLGSGIHRTVYECRIRPDLVVKVENDNYRVFANVMESKFWDDNQFSKAIAKWLAPVEFLSPDGRILLQRRVQPLVAGLKNMPEKLPAFLTDIKLDNFGILDGNLVCVDYAFTIQNVSTTMKKVTW